jgi:ribosome biogenesis GTPase
MSEVFTTQIISASRRNAWVKLKNNQIIKVNINSKLDNLIPGDIAEIHKKDDQWVAIKRLDRKNCFARSLNNRTKEIAANLDLVILITSPPELFSTDFIDRIHSISVSQNIPFCLLINKNDLGLNDIKNDIESYKKLNIKIIQTNTISPEGTKEIEDFLAESSFETVLLTGMSGVGKSSLINKLIPDANQRIGEVSSKTGKGKQTTSQSIAYIYKINHKSIVLIDTPGVQNFGIANLTMEDLAQTFHEFESFQSKCEYSDCLHQKESNCAVKQAVKDSFIALSRYNSYLSILSEIQNNLQNKYK